MTLAPPEAVGLNPATAAYTKSKPRVRAYMLQHRAAVSEKLITQEAEGMRTLNLGRDQILARLWHLANLHPQATSGSIAGQIKALSMIFAIEGLIPGRRPGPGPTQPVAPPIQPHIYVSEAMERRQVEATEPRHAGAAAEAAPAAPHTPVPSPPQPTPSSCPSPSGKHLRRGPLKT